MKKTGISDINFDITASSLSMSHSVSARSNSIVEEKRGDQLPLNDVLTHLIDKEHARLWYKLLPLLKRQQLPQAMLLSGPQYMDKFAFIHRVLSRLLCEQHHVCQDTEYSCGQCQSCHFIKNHNHPDVMYLGLTGDTLKIDEIRQLQLNIHHTPLLGRYRFVIIMAERLHVAVSNALLKVLEEPPDHVCFILLTESPMLLPLTITSRCQHHVFSEAACNIQTLMLLQSGDEDSSRRALCDRRGDIMTKWYDVILQQLSPCQFVQNFTDYELADTLWFFYWLTAQAIYSALQPCSQDILSRFAHQVGAARLFEQMRQITSLIKKNKQNITLNPALVLERLVIGYIL